VSLCKMRVCVCVGCVCAYVSVWGVCVGVCAFVCVCVVCVCLCLCGICMWLCVSVCQCGNVCV
jgi:hypothetical protein